MSILQTVPVVVLAWSRGRVLDAYGPFDTKEKAEAFIQEVIVPTLGDERAAQIVTLIKS